MKIIMLTGDSDRGKTASLHFVHEILVASGAETTLVKHIGYAYQRDFSCKLKYREKTIRIFTAGDSEEQIREVLSDKKYDFLICASNNVHRNFFNRATHRIKKTVAKTNSCMLAANLYDAGRIIELLD